MLHTNHGSLNTYMIFNKRINKDKYYFNECISKLINNFDITIFNYLMVSVSYKYINHKEQSITIEMNNLR